MANEDQVGAGQATLPRQGTGLQAVTQLVNHSDTLIQELRDMAFEPEQEKRLDRRYTITQVAKMLGRTPSAIRKAESQGQLPTPELSKAGRRIGYRLAEVNTIRDYFDLNPGRAPSDEPVRLAFQNFKGGAGKTTLSTHFSQFLALRGYRVLVVDCDSQASTTTTFGYRPDLDLDDDDILLPYFEGTQRDLKYAIRPTYWDRLDILPANLSLYSAEYSLAAASGHGPEWIEKLDRGLATVEQDYDVLILDPPPALGMISLHVVRAATALVIPTPPAMYDFHSTVTFLRMLKETLASIESALGQPIDYKFLKLVVSKYAPGKGTQEFMVRLIKQHYSRHVLDAVIKDSAEIDNAAADWRTVYEMVGKSTSSRTYKRCITSLNAAFSEIELLIRHTWPSHRGRLDDEGHTVL